MCAARASPSLEALILHRASPDGACAYLRLWAVFGIGAIDFILRPAGVLPGHFVLLCALSAGVSLYPFSCISLTTSTNTFIPNELP